ncbi:MAG: SRPBCC family protein [Streptomyces sp.]|nr:SRPBCC family protein [Streptomyces sp.]
MATFLLHRTAPLPPPEAWRRLTDWTRHGAVVPLTRVTVLTAPPTRPGTLFVARSGVGPLTVDDRMEVVDWQPPTTTAPGHCRLEKRGRTVLGWAEIEVSPEPGGRSRVTWREEIGLRFLPRLADPALKRTSEIVFGRAADRLLRMP